MNRFWFLILLLPVVSLPLACGGGNRQLESITVTSVAKGQQIEFVATGNFSAPPTTVSPLPVSWSYAPPPPQYALTTQPFKFQCNFAGPYPSPLLAWAPADPDAPISGSMSATKMIVGNEEIKCP